MLVSSSHPVAAAEGVGDPVSDGLQVRPGRGRVQRAGGGGGGREQTQRIRVQVQQRQSAFGNSKRPLQAFFLFASVHSGCKCEVKIKVLVQLLYSSLKNEVS